MNLKHQTLSTWLKRVVGLTAWFYLASMVGAQSTFTPISLNDPTLQERGDVGWAVAGAGDVNGDGLADLLVGAPGQDVNGNDLQGQVFVFSGADRSLLLTLDDPTAQPFASFGWAVAGAGDVNGDGLADLLVGAPHQDVAGNGAQGQAFVFSGFDGSLLLTLDDPTPQEIGRFSYAVAGAGDVDGDSVPDLLVGAPLKTVGGNDFQGQAFVFSGADGSLIHTLNNPTPQTGATFSYAVAGAGDVNGDNVPDLLVRANSQTVGGYNYQGQAFVFSGFDGSLLLTLDDPTPQMGASFGSAVAGVGDVDGDGVPDLLVGAPYQQGGRAFVFSGFDGSLLHTLAAPTPQVGAAFGWAVAGAGDVNGDSLADLLVGAYFQDVGTNADQGQAFVFSGADGSLLHTLDTPNPQASAAFGWAVAGVGDVDGDGLGDLLVGARWQTVGGVFESGQAFVFVSSEPDEIEIQIDIEPKSGTNRINLRREDTIQVAILSSPNFNVLLVDKESLTFGRTGGENSLLREHGVPACQTQDVNEDGLPDLLCVFRVRQTNFQCGDTVGMLKGETLYGEMFVAQDMVVIEPCRP